MSTALWKRNMLKLSIRKYLKYFSYLFLIVGSPQIFSMEILNLNFYQEGEVSKLELTLDGEGVKARRFHVIEDKQIILDLENVTATERVLRAFDTSEFAGSVVFVSPYKKPGAANDLRIALQLRDNVRSILEVDKSKLILSIENRFGFFNLKKLENNSSASRDISYGQGSSQIKIPKTSSIEDILENLTLSGTKKYIGKKISFNVKEINVADLLKMISDSSGFNIILSDEIKKLSPLTLTLTNIPWDQALDTVLGLGKLVATKNGNILMVTSLEKANEEATLEAKAKELSEKNVPLVTKIFPISFAKTEDLKKLLADYLTKGRGSIAIDARINALIVKDTVSTIEKMKKIIETLDTQTPQILIEAKIVEASEGYSRVFGLKDGIRFGYDPITSGLAGQADIGPGFAFSSAGIGGTGGSDFLVTQIGKFGRMLDLNFTLQLMESESKGKVISSPKIITENKKPAVIQSTETTSYRVLTINGGQTTESFQNVSAALRLNVTPQVTNEGSIILEVSLEKGSFLAAPAPNAPPDQTTRSMNTNVLVDNGSTIVIGGIYTVTQKENSAGIPFVKDLPLIGWLFRTAYNPSQDKNELIIFITPRIINQEEAGLVEREETVL